MVPVSAAYVLRHSLKARVTLLALCIFLGSIALLVGYGGRMLQDDLYRMLTAHQTESVALLAEQLGKEMGDRQRALEQAATSLQLGGVGSPEQQGTLLQQNALLQAHFNGGTFITDTQGASIAESDTQARRMGLSYLDRDYVQQALQGKSVLGKPVMGKVLRAPTIPMATPIKGARGQILGVMVGITNLGQTNFLDSTLHRHFSRVGEYLVVDRVARVVVTSSRQNHTLDTLPAPGTDPLMDRFLGGEEGSALYTDAQGNETLATVQTIPGTRWAVVGMLPAAEAFAPATALRQRMLTAAVLLALAACALTWWMLRQQLAPLLRAASHLDAMRVADAKPVALPITRQDEVGALIAAFNQLLERLTEDERARKQAEEKLQLAASVFTHAREGIMITDARGAIVDVNATFTQITGYSNDDVLGRNPRMLSSGRQDAAFYANLWRTMQGQGHWSGEIWNRRKDGQIFAEFLTISAVRNDKGEVTQYVALFSDITERKVMEDQVRQFAFYDALTSLPNRRLLRDRLQQAMAQSERSGQYGAVMFIDLDNFKSLNDHSGHVAGDLLLVEVAERLKRCVRGVDTVARMGGDEFVVLVSELSREQEASFEEARAVAEKVRVALGESYRLSVAREGQPDTVVEHRCTASIGVALFFRQTVGQDDVLQSADTAMYQAKAQGRNRVQMHPRDGPNRV